MTELANCPFCGKPPVTLPGKWEGFCECVTTGCPIVLRKMTISQWQTRPTEDALQSALTTAQEENRLYKLALEKYELAIKETEAILGGEYAMQYGPFFELVQDAQSALNGGK